MKESISRLGFGLSSIAGSGNFAHQQALIKTAIENGITHFDVAPYYGSGDAETILGNILQTCPEEVSITTKFGLLPFKSGKGGSLLRTVLRPVFRKMSFLKKMAASVAVPKQHPNQKEFEAGSLTRSLDESISKLKRPINIFLLHDASTEYAKNVNLVKELDEARTSGKVQLTGISGAEETLLHVTAWRPETFSVAQLENSLKFPVDVQALTANKAKVITHRAIQGGLTELSFLIEKRPGFKRIWDREIGIDPINTDLMSQILMELALNDNPSGTVLFSTTKVDRIKKNARILSSPVLGKEGCIKLRELFNAVYLGPNN